MSGQNCIKLNVLKVIWLLLIARNEFTKLMNAHYDIAVMYFILLCYNQHGLLSNERISLVELSLCSISSEVYKGLDSKGNREASAHPQKEQL